MRVKWNRHLDLGVRQRNCDAEPPEITNHASAIEGDVSVSANSLFGKKAEIQQDSNGLLSFFRSKKINHDDLSQCSVTSSNSGGGHLVRRASLPVRLKRKFRINNDCGRPSVCQPPETTAVHNNANIGTFIDSPLTTSPDRDIGQPHSTASEEIIWKRQDDNSLHPDCDFGRHSSASFSRDSAWRQTLPVPRNETENSRFSVYHVAKNPTLTKSASLSACQPTDSPCRQTISNFSQSIKSLEPTATQTTRSGKVNLFGAAKSFFSGTKTGNKKASSNSSSKSSKLKRSVSVSDSRGKTEAPVPDAGPSGFFARGRWNSVSCRVRSQSNVQEIATEKPPKTASKFSELFSNFRSSLKSLDSRSHRENYNDGHDDDWSDNRFQTATENNSVSSLLIYETTRESNAESLCSLNELNKVVLGCLLLPEESPSSSKDCSQSRDDQYSNNAEILETPNNKQLNGSMTKCELTAFECSDNLIHSKEFKTVEVSSVSETPCANSPHLYDVKFNEQEKIYSTDKDRALHRQPTLVKKDPELIHAPLTTKIDSYSNPPREKNSACQQVVVPTIYNEKCNQETNPHDSSLHVVNFDYLIDRKLDFLHKSKDGMYDNDRSENTCEEAKQVEPVVKNDANSFGSDVNTFSCSNNNRDDLNEVTGKDLEKNNRESRVESDTCLTSSDGQKMNSLCSAVINSIEQLSITKLSKAVNSIGVPVHGISTLDGTILLADDRPIFCDSNLILHSNNSNGLPNNADEVDAFQEKTIGINEFFVPSSDCSFRKETQEPALAKRDHEHYYDPVASLNPTNDKIKIGYSNDARSLNELDSTEDITAEDAIKGIEISFQMAAASNYASYDVIATERDAAENTVGAVENVEKQYTSDLHEKGIGLHGFVSHGRYGKEESGKEEIAKRCGRHSPPIIYPLIDGTVSNPRGRVRWSDTLQSLAASTEEGRELNESSSLPCGSSVVSPALFRLSTEEKTFTTFTSCVSGIQTDGTVDDLCESKEVMLSDSVNNTKSAIKDISGAIAELQNAISSTFGLGYSFSDEDLLVQDVAPANSLPTVQPCNWSNESSRPPVCGYIAPDIRVEEYEPAQDYPCVEEVVNCKSDLPNVTMQTICLLEDNLPSHVPSLSKTQNLLNAENDDDMKETYVRENFCDNVNDYQKITITTDNLYSAESSEKGSLVASPHTSLSNGELPHVNTAEIQFVSLDSHHAQHTVQTNNKTTATLDKVVDCVTELEGNPVLNMNGDSVIHMSQSINVPIDTVENLSDATESSVVDDGDSIEVSKSRNITENTHQVADSNFTKSTQLLNFDSLENLHCLQTSSELFRDVHGLHFIGSLDRIPKSNFIANNSSTGNGGLPTLWKCKSEEMLPVISSNRGCCTSDHDGNKTFCRLRRSKALAKVCIKSIKEDALFPKKNTSKITKPHSLVKVKPVVLTPLFREKIIAPDAPSHPYPSTAATRTHSDPKAGNNEISVCVMTPAIHIEAKETNCAESSHAPNAIDANLNFKSSDSSKDTKLSAKKKNIANGIGSKLVNSMSSKQTSLEAVCQVPRPLRGNNTPVVSKPTNVRGMTEKAGLSRGHARSRSSRIPRKQHEGGRPIVPPKPVRPPMWLSKAELTQEIQHLSSLCESRTKELNRLKIQTKHVTRGFDALAVAIQYMADDLHVFENPNLLLNLKQTQEKVNKEKKDLECYEKKIAALNTLHAKEMNELLETLTTRHESELQELLLKHTTEINFLREQHKNELVSFTEALQASCEEERLQQEKLIADLQKELKQQREEVEMFHQQELDDLEERYQEKQNALKEEIRKLQKQLSDAKQTSFTMEETMQKDTDSKLHWLSEKKNDLQNEVDSLKAVLEIKNNELHSLRKENLEMQKEVEELPLAKERIKMLHARAEDLQALMSEKVHLERQLSTEHKILTENYEKESKVNKRLSMENEELQWRLKQVAEQSLLSHTAGDMSETNAPVDEESCNFDEELPSPVKCSTPISSSSKPMFFTYMNDEEVALSSHSPRMHYKQIKPCSSSHRPSSAKSVKSTSSPSPRKCKGSADSSPHCGGGTPRKMAKHLNRAAQRSSVKQKLSSSTETKTQDGNVHESLEINVIGLADSLVSSASSDNSVFEPCLLEEHGEEIRETLKLLQEQNNTEFIYDVSSPTFDSNEKWHVPIGRSESATTDQNISLESVDPKTFYHVAFPVMRDSETTAEEAEIASKELSE